ncbi:NAD(P)-dependent oxidoreductase [Mariniphaga sp.]|uniref:NAD(P)-dependent oxidoreductase n=1 Tax=Mariniphaga sp. TaxID=1954475 RepID=UPI003567D8CD
MLTKLGILREGKIPPDNRVPLTPEQCIEVQQNFPGVQVIIQTSHVRCFSDEEYREKGIPVQEDVSDCDVLMGVKEVPIIDLLQGKIYFFFSHTIKKQEYNRKLLQTFLQKKIQLVDYEVLTDKNGFRIIGFGRFAGLVGAYNGLRAFGLRNRIFDLKPAHQCAGLEEMLYQLNLVNLPPVKIAFTGDGRVASGVLEVLEFMKIQRLSPEQFLETEQPEKPVYAQLLPQHYARRKDGSAFGLQHFFKKPEMYENAFLPYAHSTDVLMAAAYWDPKAPMLFTAEDMKQPGFRISVISDITCDIEGSIPSTKRASTIAEPFYDYNPETGELEAPFSSEKNVTVQAVDNLPNELPKDASRDFGRNLIDKVFPSLFGEDADEIIERASVTKDGKLTERFSYLQHFAEGE